MPNPNVTSPVFFAPPCILQHFLTKRLLWNGRHIIVYDPCQLGHQTTRNGCGCWSFFAQ